MMLNSDLLEIIFQLMRHLNKNLRYVIIIYHIVPQNGCTCIAGPEKGHFNFLFYDFSHFLPVPNAWKNRLLASSSGHQTLSFPF